MLTASTFNEFPDLQVSGAEFHRPEEGHQRQPAEGAAPLGHVRTGALQEQRRRAAQRRSLQAGELRPDEEVPDDGLHLRAALEQREQLREPGARALPSTSPTTSATATWCSNPTSSTRSGHPGQSALKCVLPAIQAVVDKGFVDEKAIGIQGHSWGGYQIAYMITQTNRFRAAEAGAPVSQHDQRLRRHPLGHGPAAPVPVRAHAEPHRRAAVRQPDALHRELAGLPRRRACRRRC